MSLQDKKNKRELGSEFWDIPISENDNKLFPEDTRWFISGTAALEYIIDDIIRQFTIKTVAIPSWCCSCMITPFLKRGINVQFYPVYVEKGELICDYSDFIADCWIMMSYFGYSTQINIGTPKGIVIRDLTHSIFTEIKNDADYYFGSLRKWAGFYTGGYAWSDNWNSDFLLPECDPLYIAIRSQAMKEKSLFINGEIDSKSYLELFEKGEDYLDHCKPMGAYEQDIRKARLLNVDHLKKQRRNNAKVLLTALKQWAIFPELDKNDCPLFVPILLDDKKRNELRNILKGQNIYCPIHWSVEDVHNLTQRTVVLYQKELSIICDQRYTEEDMICILRIIEESEVLK